MLNTTPFVADSHWLTHSRCLSLNGFYYSQGTVDRNDATLSVRALHETERLHVADGKHGNKTNPP